MCFSKEELNIILGAINCYVGLEGLPKDLKDKAESIRERMKGQVKKMKMNT